MRIPNLFSLKSCVKAESLSLSLSVFFFLKFDTRLGEFDFECCKSNINSDKVIKLFVLSIICNVHRKRSISQLGLKENDYMKPIDLATQNENLQI